MKSSSSSMWHAVGSSSSGAYNNQAANPELSEEELERQYAAYKAQFEEWIAKNRNHPDRGAYNRYVDQFKEWETQVEANRRAIREWKAARGEREGQFSQATVSKRQQNGNMVAGVVANSETSSPPLSTSSGMKKKDKKKKKKKDGEGSSTGGEAENPMMAMMKMMAASMSGTNPASAPAPAPTPAAPMDPFSMMMAMTMMMPMMMNSAPAPPSTAATELSKPASLPDISKPPPGLFPEEERGSERRYGQTERDRAVRGERQRRYPDWDRPHSAIGRQRDERRMREEEEEQEDRGDFWYQRWLSNRQRPPGPQDQWSMAPRHPPHPNPPPVSGPVPLLAPGGPRINLDRDYPPAGPPPYVNRSFFGERDFSHMKKPQHPRR